MKSSGGEALPNSSMVRYGRNGNSVRETNRVQVDVPYFADKESCMFHAKKYLIGELG